MPIKKSKSQWRTVYIRGDRPNQIRSDLADMTHEASLGDPDH